MESFFSIMDSVFLRNALLAAMLAGISCGLAGAYVVSRRLVFLSGGISHASFGGVGLAFYLGMHPPAGALVFAILAALIVQYLSDRHEVRQDSAIGIIWSVGMATGILFVYITPGYVPNLMTYLFGNILTVGTTDLWMLAGAALLSIIVFVGFYPAVLSVAFDDAYARVRRLPVDFMNYLLMIVVAITIVTAIRIAGVILVISFLTLPQATAGIFTRKLSSLALWSVLISVSGALIGIWLSYLLDIPSGASIIFTFAVGFLLVRFSSLVLRRVIRLKHVEQ